MPPATVRVEPGALEAFVREVFTSAGLAAADAATVADILVWANLRGVDSHGVLRVPRYLQFIDLGLARIEAEMRITIDTPSTFVLEADRAFGPVALDRAMKLAIDKARVTGLCWGLVRNTTHCGAVGYYALQAARADMAGIVFSTSIPNMAYHGARMPGVATSPIAIAVPGQDHAPVMLDMATAIAAVGKLAQARNAGLSIPEGWALTAAGEPTTDPKQAVIPMPLGGPKGAGLALMFECLTSLFVGNPLIEQELTGPEGVRRHSQNAAVIAIDIAPFIDPATYRANVDRMIAAIKTLPRAEGTDEILVPGERGDRVLVERHRDGIPLPPGTWRGLGEVAQRFAIDPPPTL